MNPSMRKQDPPLPKGDTVQPLEIEKSGQKNYQRPEQTSILKSLSPNKDKKLNWAISEKVDILIPPEQLTSSSKRDVLELQKIQQDASEFLNKNVNSQSQIFNEINALLKNLNKSGDITDENFVCPWYILVIYLDTLEENIVNSRIHDYLKETTNIRQNLEKFFMVLVYFVGRDINIKLKTKILKAINYDLTILNKESNKNKQRLIDLILDKDDYEYLDLLMREAKTMENCKAYTVEEMEHKIILEISYQKLFLKSNILKILSPVHKNQMPKEEEKLSLLNPKSQGNSPNNARTKETIYKQNVIEFCIEHKLIEITKILFRKFPNEALFVETIEKALEHKSYDYLIYNDSINRIKNVLIKKNSIMVKIISFLEKPDTFLDGVFFLYAVKDLVLNQDIQKCLYETFKRIIRDNEKRRILLFNLNPLLIFVMLSQIFYHLAKNCFHYQHSFKKFSSCLKNIASQIVEKYDHFYNLKSLAFHIYYPSRKPLITMVFEDKELFDSLFQGDRLAKITRLQLNCFYTYDWNLFACSTSFKYMIFKRFLQVKPKVQQEKLPEIIERQTVISPNHQEIKINNSHSDNKMDWPNLQEHIEKIFNREKEKIAGMQIFNYICKTSEEEVNDPNQRNHCYQYKIYLKSVSYRIIWDAFLFLSLFVYLHVNTNQYSSIRNALNNIDPNYSNWLYDMYVKYDDNGNLLPKSDLTNIINDTSFDEFKFDVPYHCKQELANLTGNNQTLMDIYQDSCIKFHNTEINLETSSNNLMYLCYAIIVVLFNVFVRKFYQAYVKKTFSLLLIDKLDLFGLVMSIILVILHNSFHDSFYQAPTFMLADVNITSVFIALLLFMFWLQMFQYIKLTQRFGYIIKTLELLVETTYNFLWIFFLFIAAFSSINMVLFGSFTSDYSAFFLGVRNLFGYALGGFKFIDDAPSYYYIWESGIITIVFVLYTNVILINLLIALLTNIYQKVSDNSDLEYSSIIYDLKQEKYFDKFYGSVTIYPRVINAILIPIHILVFSLKNAKFNLFIGSIAYYISLSIYAIVFVCMHFFIIPLAWFNVIILIFFYTYHDNLISKQITWSSKFQHFVIWFFLGIPYLVYALFRNDMALFFKNAFYSNKTKKKESTELTPLEYCALKSLLKNKKYMIPIDEDLLVDTEEFIENYRKYGNSMEKLDYVLNQSRYLFESRSLSILHDIKLRESTNGIMTFEQKTPDLKLNKMMEILREFSVNNQISIKALRLVLISMKTQIKFSQKKKKKKEINKLEGVNYHEVLEISEEQMEKFLKDNKSWL